MAIVDLIIDLGTQNTSIYKMGEGLVLKEPSLVLVRGKIETGKIVAYGEDALKTVSSRAVGYKLLYPLADGGIVFPRATKAMLNHFIKKVVDRNDYFLKPKIRVFLNVPCGYQEVERDNLVDMFQMLEINDVFFMESPLFANFDSQLDVVATPRLVVDIGGGVTDVAYIGESGIEFGYSYGIGGLGISRGIMEIVEDKMNTSISFLVAESIKCEVGTLRDNENGMKSVTGKNYTTGISKEIRVTSKTIRPVLEYYYGKICDIIRDVIGKLPLDVLTNLHETGIIVVGGGAKIPGLAKFMQSKLEVRILIPNEPELSAIKGGAVLAHNPELMNALLGLN